jgi:hypothetical protein
MTLEEDLRHKRPRVREILGLVHALLASQAHDLQRRGRLHPANGRRGILGACDVQFGQGLRECREGAHPRAAGSIDLRRAHPISGRRVFRHHPEEQGKRFLPARPRVGRTRTAYEIANRLAQAIEKKNPTQSVRLLCNALYEEPIKRGIVYRGTIDFGVLVSQRRGFTSDEKEAINDDLRKKGLPISSPYSRRLMVLYDRNRI